MALDSIEQATQCLTKNNSLGSYYFIETFQHVINYTTSFKSSFEAKKYQRLIMVKPTLRAVVSPGRTLRHKEP